MKKSTLALGVAAAIAGFGFSGSAMAIGNMDGGAGVTATQLVVNPDNIGHQLVVPYFSTQSGNVTFLNVTNTDQVNGKLVKVRFRGAANSDDIFDFTLMLSPGDVWTAGVSQDPATGVSTLRTTDASCVVPSSVKASTGALFITGRVDATPAKGTAANETREGYVEIIQMADITPTLFTAAVGAAAKAATLYGTTKHTAGVAACDGTVLATIIGTDYTDAAAAIAVGIEHPTGGLAADWVILNQTSTAAWSGNATALEARTAGAAGVKAAGNIVFWPQLNGLPNMAGDAANLAMMDATADPIFVTGVVTIQNYDLPDLSTAYTTTDNAALNTAHDGAGASIVAGGAAVVRADALSAALQVKSITNSYVTNSGIAGVTDFVFSQPTRRYSVGVNYKATAATNNTVSVSGATAAAVFRGAVASNAGGTGSAYYTSTAGQSVLSSRQVCLTSVAVPSAYDREETKLGGTSFVISPGVATSFALCGEAAVLSLNSGGVVAGSALNATVVRNDITFGAGFDLGYAVFNTSNGATGLPILGYAATRVANGTVNYGFTAQHKVTR